MREFEFPPAVTLYEGDSLTFTWVDYGEDELELLDYRVIPSLAREAAALSALRHELEGWSAGETPDG